MAHSLLFRCRGAVCADLVLVVLSVLLVGSGCVASSGVDSSRWVDTGGWNDASRSERASRIGEYNAVVEPGPAWRAGELEAVESAIRDLPSFLHPPESEPLRIVRVQKRCLFAVGRYTDGCPTFGDDGEFYLYDPSSLIDDYGPTSRLEWLSDEQRHRLLVKRAVTHALVARADRRYGWSETDRWRSINGWDRGGERPFNNDVYGYLRPLGKRSAHLDLVTAAEAFFFRVEDVALRAETEVEHFDPDRSFGCQEFTRSRVLSRFFSQLEEDWRAGTVRDPQRPSPDCEAFDQWARFEQLDGIEILYASEALDRPESLFGHLLLHIRHDHDGVFRSQGFEYVYQFGALADPEHGPLGYVMDGMTGQYDTIFDLTMFRSLDLTYLQLDQRSLRRYELRLDDGQTRRLMERIWEVERRFSFPYYFTTHNCASMVLDLLDPALPERAPLPRRIATEPTDVLDILAGETAHDGGPLLESHPGDYRSTRARALGARRRIDRFRRRLDVSEPPGAELDETLERLLEESPQQRAELYPVLVEELTDGYEQGRVGVEDLFAVAESLVQIERAGFEKIRARHIRYLQESLVDPDVMELEEMLEFRRRLYRHEDHELRSDQRNELARRQLEQFLDGERRPPNDSERQLRERRDRLRASFEAATIAEGRLVEFAAAEDEEFDPSVHQSATRELWRRRQHRLDRRSLSVSNSNRVRIGVAAPIAGGRGGTGWVPSVELSAALLDDRLGQRRLHGHHPQIEATLFDTRVRVPVPSEVFDRFDAEMTLLRYITVATANNAVRRGIADYFGGGLELEVGFDGGADAAYARGFAGPFLPLWMNLGGVGHLVVGLGPAVVGYQGLDSSLGSVGLQGVLLARHHLHGALANVAYLRLRHLQGLEFPNPANHRDLELEVGVDLSISAGRLGLLISPHLRGRMRRAPADRSLDALSLLAGFRVEPLIFPPRAD